MSHKEITSVECKCTDAERLAVHPFMPARTRQILSKAALTPNEFSEVAKRDRATVHKALKAGEIPSFTLAETINIPTTWVLKVLGLTA